MSDKSGNEVLLLDPKVIKVGWRARQDYGDIDALAASIKELGQMQPVNVRQKKDGTYAIIAGLRRTRACRKLGIPVKAMVVAPKDEEQLLKLQLHENLKRKDFDRLEVGEGLKRMKTLYEKSHPETKQGGAGKGRDRVPKSGTLTPNFVEMASADLGVSKQSVYDLLGIADLPAEDKAEVESAKTPRERNVAASKALSKVRKKRKVEKLEKVAEKKEKQRAAEVKKVKKKIKGKKSDKVKAVKQTIFLHTGDCLEFMQSGEILKPGSVDLLCTDPPYGKDRKRIDHKLRMMINEAKPSWDELDVSWVLAAAPLLDKTGSLISFCPLEAVGDYELVFKKAGLIYRGAIVWKKTNPPPAHRSVYVPSVEAFVWATKSESGYSFKPWDNPGSKNAHNMVEGPICGGNERLDHPTQKPLWLMKQILTRHATKGSVVLDPFCGVGTTLVAAKQMGMICHGVEKSKAYVKQAVTRLKAL